MGVYTWVTNPFLISYFRYVPRCISAMQNRIFVSLGNMTHAQHSLNSNLRYTIIHTRHQKSCLTAPTNHIPIFASLGIMCYVPMKQSRIFALLGNRAHVRHNFTANLKYTMIIKSKITFNDTHIERRTLHHKVSRYSFLIVLK